MEATRTNDDDDVFIECKFAIQCYSKDPKCRAELNHRSADRDTVRMIKLFDLLTRASDDSFCLGQG